MTVYSYYSRKGLFEYAPGNPFIYVGVDITVYVLLTGGWIYYLPV